jgi:anti-sigma regulatory factor (Ser/Thr protein kinase)
VTGTVQPTGTWRAETFAHEAFLYQDDAELVHRCVPFVEEGLAADQPVAVVLSARTYRVLREALGEAAQHLAVFPPAETWWHGGHATLLAYERTIRAPLSAGGPWRLIGEPTWLADPGGDVWSRYEAIINRCYAGVRYYHLCPHDRRRLGPTLIENVLRTHPLVWHGDRPVPSPTYQDPEAFVRSTEPAWAPRPRNAVALAVSNPREARRMIAEASRRAGLNARADEMAVAVHELVVNSLQVAPTADLATWTTPEAFVCEVADSGPGLSDSLAGYAPLAERLAKGRGLWLARSLADDSSIRGDAGGTAVRLFFRR